MIKYCLLIFVLLVACKPVSCQRLTASTPAGREVRLFLGISLEDSVDFIRWTLELNSTKFNLQCNYGIGQNNTNGFIDGGKLVSINGTVSSRENKIVLNNKDRILVLKRVNDQIFHIEDDNNHLLVGNGGWSYALNMVSAKQQMVSTVRYENFSFGDSAIFEGRTPCGIPELSDRSTPCYKLKWKIKFYSKSAGAREGQYAIDGTAWRKTSPKKGQWKFDSAKSCLILFDDANKAILHLVPIDKNLLYFSMSNQSLLVGDQDFSYVLNRR